MLKAERSLAAGAVAAAALAADGTQSDAAASSGDSDTHSPALRLWARHSGSDVYGAVRDTPSQATAASTSLSASGGGRIAR